MTLKRKWRKLRMRPIQMYWRLWEIPAWHRFLAALEAIDREAEEMLAGSWHQWDPYIDEWLVKAKSDDIYEALIEHKDALAQAGRLTGVASIRIDPVKARGIFVHNFAENGP
jgi:hypothetical protein